MKRRFFSLLLCLAVLLTVAAPLAVGATEDTMRVVTGGGSNPLYGEVYVPEYEPEAPIVSRTRAAVYLDLNNAAEDLRDAMVNREETVTLNLYRPEGWADDGEFVDYVQNVLLPKAYSIELAEGATDGDYLAWSWRDYRWSGGRGEDTGYVTFTIRYYTTAAQEREVLSLLEDVLDSMPLEDYTTYGVYAALNEYVTENVDYDLESLEAYNQLVRELGVSNVPRKDHHVFTAHAALTEGKSVCQGYACVYYALCRMLDLPVRIVTSSYHAWNIVELDGKWYNLDTTWDSDTASGTDWFLTGSDTFESHSGHQREPQYLTSSYLSTYPVPAEDYVPLCPYWDMDNNDYHAADVGFVTELNLFNGMSEHTFGPTDNMQRGQLVTVMWRMNGKPAAGSDSGFSDVPAEQYYAEPVTWAAAAEPMIVNGVGGGKFAPTDDVTREQLVTILYRYAVYEGLDVSQKADLDGYADQDDVSSWAKEATQWAVGTGIVKGVSNTELAPEANATRQQLATMIARFVRFYGLD